MTIGCRSSATAELRLDRMLTQPFRDDTVAAHGDESGPEANACAH